MVTNNGQPLSQADIDSMFKRTAPEPPPPPKAPAPPTATAQPIAQQVRTVSASPVPPVAQASAERLAQFEVALAEIKAAVAQLSQSREAPGNTKQMESALAETQAAVGQLSQSLQAVVQHLRSLQTQVETMMTGLQGTPGFKVHETFVCNTCGSQGTAAQPVRCTHCGQETWLGWWPPQKQA